MCRRHLAQLRQDYQQFRDRDAEILALGAYNSPALRYYWQRYEIPFVGLSNPSASIMKDLGQQFRILLLGRIPSVLIVDKDGYLRMEHHGRSPSDIPDNSVVLAHLDALNEERVRTEPNQERTAGG